MAGPFFHLPSVSCALLPGSEQRDQCVQTDGGEKGAPQSQHSWIPSGGGDELERLRGADGKETCLFEDLELLSEWGGGRDGGCVCEGLEQEGELCRQDGELCRQQRGSLIRTDPKS